MAEDAQPSTAMQALAEAEALLAVLPKAFDAQKLTAFRAQVSSYPDMGVAGAGEVVASLFMLLGRLLGSGVCDREALSVHVRAWRLMLTAPPEAASTAILLDGLKSIRDLYDDVQAA
jgi:hypothetical protein